MLVDTLGAVIFVRLGNATELGSRRACSVESICNLVQFLLKVAGEGIIELEWRRLMEKSLLIMQFSEFIVEALIDTLGCALLSNVFLVSKFIKWGCCLLAIESDHPLVEVTEACSLS
jgi:hypothetical protein